MQVVGSTEGAGKPYTDSLTMCRYAGMLYLNPDLPARCDTRFLRERLGWGRLVGNRVMPPGTTRSEALDGRNVPPKAFAEHVKVLQRHNRLLVYNANIIHSASG